MGAEDYLTKPFNPTLLHARVEASLEKKRLREQEQQHREQALRAEATIERHRSLAEMVAGVAHEINTPLGIASTALSVIENRLSSQAIRTALAGNGRDREFLEDVLSAADLLKKNVLRAHKLVETFKKISVNQITDTLEKVNVSSLLSDAVELFQLNARQARLSINIDCSGVKGGNEWVGYPGYLTQVIMNFLQNIERYAYPAGSGGKVDVRLTDDGQGEAGDFSLLVRDYGRGIAPGDLGKVFDPFFTTGRSRGGTGLGLAIVDTIVRSVLKGQIAVTSEFGKETCFKLTFPKNLGDTPERKGAGSIHVTGDEAEDGASSAESRGRGTSSS
jgi:signal transduction histidine kinase